MTTPEISAHQANLIARLDELVVEISDVATETAKLHDDMRARWHCSTPNPPSPSCPRNAALRPTADTATPSARDTLGEIRKCVFCQMASKSIESSSSQAFISLMVWDSVLP